ncbi:MAG: AAA family ATPase [Myxococcales bacterium]
MHRGVRSRILRATQRSTGEPVVLKESAGEPPHALALARLEREYTIGKSIRSPHVVRYLAVKHERDRVTLVEEAFGDTSLAQLLRAGPLESDRALHLARQVALGLSEIHRQDVVHRAIHPGNIVVNTQLWTAKIVDFAWAVQLPQQGKDGCETPPLELDEHAMPLAYISPEHTGRIHRGVDHRSDFYSLGAVLYHALAGRTPFESSDALAMVHSHIALTAPALSELDPRIPQHVSRLVEKLLAKSPDERYQSARGIVVDLDECLWRLRSGNPQPFALGVDDLPERFVVSERHYGRSSERAALLGALDAAVTGHKTMLLVSGDPGLGKSSLIGDLREPTLKRGGRFVSGKFDQVHRNAPYSALAQALGQLCRCLLSLPEHELSRYRREILERTSSNAGLIVGLVPELEKIVGPQAEVPETSLVQAQDRFDLTLARFLSVFAGPQRPLVMFLDDLQWADAATLHALSALLRLPEPPALLVIGAYRASEVSPDHPLSSLLAELERQVVDVRQFALSGLTQQDVQLWVADTLHRDDVEVEALAELIAERTGKNPFYIDQFLRALYEHKLLRFSAEHGRWTWDLREVEDLGITASLAELMAKKLQRLPPATQSALQLAACVGNQFDLQLIAAAADTSSEDMRARLAPAIRERLIVALEDRYPSGLVDVSAPVTQQGVNYHYRFRHDRLQQIAAPLEHERAPLHLRVGRVMRDRRSPADSDPDVDAVFDIVDHLNRGVALIDDPREQLSLAELNLQAGQRARSGTAYEQGLRYHESGLEALQARAGARDPAHVHYALWFALQRGRVECAYLAGRFEDAGRLLEEMTPGLRSVLERAELETIRIGFETNRGNYARAVELGREVLAALGHPIPDLRSNVPLVTTKVKTEVVLRAMGIERFAKQRDATDPQQVAVLKLMSQLHAPAFIADRKLFFWFAHEGMRLAARHGLTSVAATFCSGYSGYLVAREHDYERAYAYGQLGLALARRPDAFAYRGQVHVLFAICANAFVGNHIRSSLPIVQRGIEMGLQSGDYFFASFGASWVPEFRFLLGEPLQEVCAEAEHQEREIRALRGDERLLLLRTLRQLVRCLRGQTLERLSLSTDDLSEEQLRQHIRERDSVPARGQLFLCKLTAYAWFGAHREVVRVLLEAGSLIEEANAANLRLSEYTFLVCLSLVEARSDPAFEGAQIEALLEPKLALLKQWAESAPVNFQHRYALVQAELAEAEGRRVRAAEFYERAIRLATENGYPHHAALALELTARAHARRGNTDVARGFSRAAREAYQRWGAFGKVRALDEVQLEYTASPGPAIRPTWSLDMESALRASQALASEISMPVLLDRMLHVIVQASGAQRGALLVSRQGEFRVRAHLDLQSSQLRLASEDAPLEDDTLVSQAIVRYTLRTGKDVALENAGQVGPFTADPYVVFHHSKSILCMAVRHRDHVPGLLFLENSLADGVFTEERLELLRVLLAQAAISLENAQLFEATQKLNSALRSSESLLREFFEGMPVGVYVVDAKGRHAFSNRRAGELLRVVNEDAGWPGDTLGAYSIYVAGTDQPYPTERTPLARALRGERSMVDDIEIRIDGKVVPLAVWGTPVLGEDGAIRYAMAAFQDIGPQRAAEAERTRLEHQLHQAERLEFIGRLAGGVAHDFNNLLTPMLIYAELAQQALPEDSTVRRHVTQVKDAAEQAAELTKQLLAFGRQQVLKPHILDLNAELGKFERMLRRVLRENIAIELHLASDLGQVRADPAQMQRVLMNLAMNAADAMPRGGRMTFETRNVLLPEVSDAKGAQGEGQSGPCVLLRVSDTGIGMDKEAMGRAFAPFFTTKEVGKGTGLGLPTVHGIVAQHGGRVELSSEVGKGTRFDILLPRVDSVPGEPRAGAQGEQTSAPRSETQSQFGRGESLLVVEDNDSVRTVVREVLARDGYRVLTTRDPLEALRLVQRAGEAPNLVISDVVMPGMSGYELVDELRRVNLALPVLLISGYSDPVTLGRDMGPSVECVAKPLNADTLRATVRRLLDGARSS